MGPGAKTCTHGCSDTHTRTKIRDRLSFKSQWCGRETSGREGRQLEKETNDTETQMCTKTQTLPPGTLTGFILSRRTNSDFLKAFKEITCSFALISFFCYNDFSKRYSSVLCVWVISGSAESDATQVCTSAPDEGCSVTSQGRGATGSA